MTFQTAKRKLAAKKLYLVSTTIPNKLGNSTWVELQTWYRVKNGAGAVTEWFPNWESAYEIATGERP